MKIADRIAQLVAKQGSLRAVAKHLDIDVAYLQRLSTGERNCPSRSTLAKLGLARVVTYNDLDMVVDYNDDKPDVDATVAQLEAELRNMTTKHQAVDAAYSAQREALTRVEAERDGLRVAVEYESARRRHTSCTLRTVLAELQGSQAQLAEAARLLRDYGHSTPGVHIIQAFVDRIAQAERSWVAHSEQQEAQGAQAGEFQREDRYIVIKRKDLEDLASAPGETHHYTISKLRTLLDMLAKHLPKREYLVIESDWPEYETAWAAIQTRVTGQGAQAWDELASAALANQPAAGEPVYQNKNVSGDWADTSKVYYEYQKRHGWPVRVLYTAAPAAAPVAAGEPVAWRYKERPDDMRSSWCYTHKRKGIPAGWPFQELFTSAPPAAAAHGDEVDQFFDQVKDELRRARAKFPGDLIMTLALAEEFGELCKAVLDESAEAVRKEAVQVACMAARVVLDGDGSVVDWRRERGLDALLADAAVRNKTTGDKS